MRRGSTTTRLLPAAALTIAVLAFALPGATLAQPKPRACGLVGRFDGRLYDVRETRGSVPCRAVRRVVTSFFKTGAIRPARGWVCVRGHADAAWAVSCGRGSSVVVRVYAPT